LYRYGAVRTLDAEKGVFTELFTSEDDDEFSACDVTADGRTAYLTDNRGNFHVVDVRSGKLAAPTVQLHAKKINTVHVEPGAERLIATSCGDQTVCVWWGCTSRMQLTHSLKAPGFNLRAYTVRNWCQSLLSSSTCTATVWDVRAAGKGAKPVSKWVRAQVKSS
jgi:WD40 repeat protein